MQLADYIIMFMFFIVIISLVWVIYKQISDRMASADTDFKKMLHTLCNVIKKRWRDAASYFVKIFLVFWAVFFLWTELDFGMERVFYAITRSIELIIVLCIARIVTFVYKKIFENYYDSSIGYFRFTVFYLAIISYMVFDLSVTLHPFSVVLALLLLVLSYAGNVISMFRIAGVVKNAKQHSLKMLWLAVGMHIAMFILQLSFTMYFIYRYTESSYTGISLPLRVFDFLYYVFMTFSTVGCHDIAPVSDLAKIFSMITVGSGLLCAIFLITLMISIISTNKQKGE